MFARIVGHSPRLLSFFYLYLVLRELNRFPTPRKCLPLEATGRRRERGYNHGLER